MRPRIKFGLIVGVIGLVLNICVSTALGICGPFLTLIAGGLSGYLAAHNEKAPTKNEGAKIGAIAGLVSGGCLFVGQMLGGVGALLLVQSSGAHTIFGAPPALNAGTPNQLIYYLSGLGTGACFGVVGLVLAALAGAGIAYLTTVENKLPYAAPEQGHM